MLELVHCPLRPQIGWRFSLTIVKPDTVIAWRRQGLRQLWTWEVLSGKTGRPFIPRNVRELIRKIIRENPLWGIPRSHGELLTLGIDIG